MSTMVRFGQMLFCEFGQGLFHEHYRASMCSKTLS